MFELLAFKGHFQKSCGISNVQVRSPTRSRVTECWILGLLICAGGLSHVNVLFFTVSGVLVRDRAA